MGAVVPRCYVAVIARIGPGFVVGGGAGSGHSP
jgi:hypothetical protein